MSASLRGHLLRGHLLRGTASPVPVAARALLYEVAPAGNSAGFRSTARAPVLAILQLPGQGTTWAGSHATWLASCLRIRARDSPGLKMSSSTFSGSAFHSVGPHKRGPAGRGRPRGSAHAREPGLPLAPLCSPHMVLYQTTQEQVTMFSRTRAALTLFCSNLV